jgi:ElaB/YqjD/DUF883 family membrane-anchored ribosome-binding protein
MEANDNTNPNGKNPSIDEQTTNQIDSINETFDELNDDLNELFEDLKTGETTKKQFAHLQKKILVLILSIRDLANNTDIIDDEALSHRAVEESLKGVFYAIDRTLSGERSVSTPTDETATAAARSRLNNAQTLITADTKTDQQSSPTCEVPPEVCDFLEVEAGEPLAFIMRGDYVKVQPTSAVDESLTADEQEEEK